MSVLSLLSEESHGEHGLHLKYFSSLRTAALCCALQSLPMIVLCTLLSFRVVYDRSGSNPLRLACRLLKLLIRS